MSMRKFESPEDLSKYLAVQEERILKLEQDNSMLTEILDTSFISENELQNAIKDSLPKTGLFSDSLYKRAFSVWGHFIFAQLFIGIIFAFGYFVIFILILKAVFPK